MAEIGYTLWGVFGIDRSDVFLSSPTGKTFYFAFFAGFASPAPEGKRILENRGSLHFNQWIR